MALGTFRLAPIEAFDENISPMEALAHFCFKLASFDGKFESLFRDIREKNAA